jgi:hypothetical protein
MPFGGSSARHLRVDRYVPHDTERATVRFTSRVDQVRTVARDERSSSPGEQVGGRISVAVR